MRVLVLGGGVIGVTTARCLALLTATLLTGCGAARYYAQSVTGHLELMSRARSIDNIVAATDIEPRLASRLRTAVDIRAFASSVLGLPDNDSYSRYVDLGRPYVVWNVVAAPELSLAPRRWCFPVVGCLSYRGYFSRAAAEAYGAELESGGWDVTVGGVRAYSTLGWFSDPLLSSMVELPEYDLAGIVFHELAHQRLYVAGDTDFNESFAVVVMRAGVRRWLESGDRTGLKERYRVSAERRAAFLELVRSTRGQLESVYASSRSDEEKRKEKADCDRAAPRRVHGAPGHLDERPHLRPVVRAGREQRRDRTADDLRSLGRRAGCATRSIRR